MRFTLVLLVCFLTLLIVAQPTPPRTMRVDYYHTGNATEEHFSLDEAALEGEWPGPSEKAIDDTNLGKYLFEVIDRRTNRVLYSRGYASIYGEWETTDEAKEMRRTFHESIRFPAPAVPVQVVIKKRDRNGAFREAWSTLIDPAAQTVNRAAPPAGSRAWAVMKNGEPRDQVDLLIDGRWLHSRRDGEMASRCKTPGRDVVHDLAVQGAAQIIQRLGRRYARRRERRVAAIGWSVAAVAAPRQLRRFRIGAVCPDVR